MERIKICGVGIDNLTKGDAVGRSLRGGGETCVVFTPNAVMLDACRRAPHLSALLNRASLSLPDGAGVLMAARRQGTPLKERIAGIDFAEALMARAEKDGLRVFLLGGKDGVAARAAENLRTRYPALCICGTAWGYFDREGEENRQLLSRIRALRADVLFVCLGFPLQEEWIVNNLGALSGLRVVAGLGGSLDVWSGGIRRAPAPISKMGLEWAWRMAREPKRLRQLPALVRFCVRRE